MSTNSILAFRVRIFPLPAAQANCKNVRDFSR